MDNTNEKYEVLKCPNCEKDITHITGTGTDFKCPYCNELLNKDAFNLPEPQSKSHKVRNILFHKITISGVALLFFVLTIISTMHSNSLSQNVNTLSDKVDTITEDYDSLTDDYDSVDKKYLDLVSSNKTLESDYKKIESEVNNYKDQQATINDLNLKLTELQSQYSALEADRNSLQGQLDAKKAEQQRIAEEQAAQQAAQQQANAIEGSVYWVSGGEVYHSTPNCSTLKRSSNIQSGSVSQSGKSRACKVCN